MSASASPPGAGEELVRVRCGEWRLLLPMRHVERVEEAALPAVRPAAGAPLHPVVSLGGDLVPVLFCAALLGAEEVTLSGGDQMVLLADRGRRAFLWVSAAEEVVPHEPAAGRGLAARPGSEVVSGFSGADEVLAVLDVSRLLDLALPDEGAAAPEGGAPPS